MKELTLKQLNRLDEKPLFSVKDPISALTHFIGFIGAVVASPFLLVKASCDGISLPLQFGLTVFGLSMILLYGASTAYHTFILPSRPARILKKTDHMSIFVLIAGTYTPLCISMPEKTGKPLLLAIWLIALGGIILKAAWVYCPKYVSSLIYISMGWLALFRIVSIYEFLGIGGFSWLIAGGIMYTIGGIIYARKIVFNKDWGNHEIFHLFVLLGTICHFILILVYIA